MQAISNSSRVAINMVARLFYLKLGHQRSTVIYADALKEDIQDQINWLCKGLLILGKH